MIVAKERGPRQDRKLAKWVMVYYFSNRVCSFGGGRSSPRFGRPRLAFPFAFFSCSAALFSLAFFLARATSKTVMSCCCFLVKGPNSSVNQGKSVPCICIQYRDRFLLFLKDFFLFMQKNSLDLPTLQFAL